MYLLLWKEEMKNSIKIKEFGQGRERIYTPQHILQMTESSVFAIPRFYRTYSTSEAGPETERR